jgi:hypothetical protein
MVKCHYLPFDTESHCYLLAFCAFIYSIDLCAQGSLAPLFKTLQQVESRTPIASLPSTIEGKNTAGNIGENNNPHANYSF